MHARENRHSNRLAMIRCLISTQPAIVAPRGQKRVAPPYGRRQQPLDRLGIAKGRAYAHGAEVALTYQAMRWRRRVRPLAAELKTPPWSATAT